MDKSVIDFMNQKDERLLWFSCCFPWTVFWIPCVLSQLIMNHELQQNKSVPLKEKHPSRMRNGAYVIEWSCCFPDLKATLYRWDALQYFCTPDIERPHAGWWHHSWGTSFPSGHPLPTIKKSRADRSEHKHMISDRHTHTQTNVWVAVI